MGKIKLYENVRVFEDGEFQIMAVLCPDSCMVNSFPYVVLLKKIVNLPATLSRVFFERSDFQLFFESELLVTQYKKKMF